MKLFNYQKESVKFLIRNKKSILRLDTGLGKTCVCIEAAKKMSIKKVLVIAPAFLISNWVREVEMWGEGGLNWVFVSYNKISGEGVAEKYRGRNFGLVVCDEAHYLKNWSAKRTRRIIKDLLVKVDRVVFSTATPYVRSAADLHPLYSVCEAGKWGKIGAFQEKYCLKKYNHFNRWKKFDYYGVNPALAGELKVAGTKFMISYKKGEVLADLPEKIESFVDVAVNRSHYLKNLDVEEYYDIDTGKMKGGLKRILSSGARELGEAKAARALDWIENFNGDCLVVFCKHKDVARMLGDALDGSKIITGDTGMSDRDSIVQEFQAGKFKYLVCTIGSCGVGINLFKASFALFVELPWSYAELKQCADRLHRIGQKSCVNIIKLVTYGTLDDLLVRVIENKIDGEEMTIGGM